MELMAMPETGKIKNLTGDALSRANDLTIASNNDFEAAGAFREALREIEKQVDDTFDHLITQAHKHHKTLVAEKKRHAEPIEQARAIIKAKMIDWEDLQEKHRRDEENRLRVEAIAKAESELLLKAAEAEKNGDKALAEAIVSAPIQAPAVTLPKATPKANGYMVRTLWDGEVTDIKALVSAAASRPELLGLLQVNQTALRQMATATKGAVQIPGVRFTSRKV